MHPLVSEMLYGHILPVYVGGTCSPSLRRPSNAAFSLRIHYLKLVKMFFLIILRIILEFGLKKGFLPGGAVAFYGSPSSLMDKGEKVKKSSNLF